MPASRSARLLSLAALATLAAYLPAGGAFAQEEPRQTASLIFSDRDEGDITGLRIKIAYRNPDDPESKPFAVQKVVTKLAPGTRIDTSVPARCGASDEELIERGARACPGASVVGGGSVSVDTGAGVLENKATLLNNTGELIFLTESTGPPPRTRLVVRAQIRGRTITNEVPPIPGGPPDGFAAIRDADLRIGTVVRRQGGRLRGYLTTPRRCPGDRAFTGSIEFTYRDGVTQEVASGTPCVPLDLEPPRIALRGLPPRDGCASRSFCARVRVRDASSMRAVRVRLNSRPLFTTRRKRFSVRLPARSLRAGRNRLRVIATDRRGNRLRRTGTFLRCR